MRRNHPLLFLSGVALLALALLVACGGSDSSTTTGGDGSSVTSSPVADATTGDGGAPDPCDLATADMVAAAFGGTASDGQPGIARNCGYEIDGGATSRVDLYYYGTAGQWDGIRVGFEANRGGTTDLAGIGDIAFYPNDAGPTELVILAGDVVYSVSAGFNAGAVVDAGVAALALAIAAGITG
jgi:hypothetical protein